MRRVFCRVLVLIIICAAGATGQRLPFINDDYGKAVAEARQRKIPVFVEAWAPW